jgi:hypothetical protein
VLEAQLRGDDRTVRGARRPPFLDLHGREQELRAARTEGLGVETLEIFTSKKLMPPIKLGKSLKLVW